MHVYGRFDAAGAARTSTFHRLKTDNGVDLVRSNGKSNYRRSVVDPSRNDEGRSTLLRSSLRTRTTYERATEIHRCRQSSITGSER
jgi:hypothetical protein